MRKFTLLCVIVTLGLSVSSQSFSYFLDQVNNLPVNERQAAVDTFMDIIESKGIPYINVDTANFIYQGEVNSVGLPGDFNGWDPGVLMLSNISGTDFWYYSKIFETNARLDYKFVLDGSNWITDPLNPNYVTGGYGPNSELAMPDYVQPWEIDENPTIEQGTVESFMIESENTSSSFATKVYLPPNYDPTREEPYPVAYFQDGYEYISLGSADIVLDNLIDANLIDPIIGVFVRPNNRNEEYAGNMRNEYRLFFAEELVPYIDAHYKTIRHAWGRAIIGPSFGGNISALISYNHPDVFGMCGLHSGAFWPNDYEAYYMITEGEINDIIYSSIWGSYEGLYESMRAFRDYLLDNNYELDWLELPEGHSWGLWRATLDNMLIYFFPPGYAGVSDFISPEIGIVKIFPNPVKDATVIQFEIDKTSDVHIVVQGLDGKQLLEIEYINPIIGRNEVSQDFSKLPDGIYLVKVYSGNSCLVGKVVKQ